MIHIKHKNVGTLNNCSTVGELKNVFWRTLVNTLNRCQEEELHV